MEKEFKHFNPQIPEKEPLFERGDNVKMRVFFGRHSNYDQGTGHLNKEGKVTAEAFGKDFIPLGEGGLYIMKGYSSEFDRAKETLSEIIKNSSAERVGTEKMNSKLGSLSDDFYIKDLNTFIEKGAYQDKERTITVKELAQDVAERLKIFIEMSKRLYSNSQVDLLNITHLPWLLCFLKELNLEKLEEVNPRGNNFVERIGGSINYVEGFEILIDRKSTDEFSLTLKFRNQEVKIPYEKINSLLASNEEHDTSG